MIITNRFIAISNPPHVGQHRSGWPCSRLSHSGVEQIGHACEAPPRHSSSSGIAGPSCSEPQCSHMSSPLSRMIRSGAPQFRQSGIDGIIGESTVRLKPVTTLFYQSMSGTGDQKFSAALDDLVEQIKEERPILAAILCGSLSHDTVWAKSDIDLLLVTVDDKKIDSGDVSLYADGVNVHAILLPRAQFRKTVEGSLRNSFMHSLLAKGRLLYTHDPTIADLTASLTGLGDRDTRVQLLAAATSALPSIYKAHKWF